MRENGSHSSMFAAPIENELYNEATVLVNSIVFYCTYLCPCINNRWVDKASQHESKHKYSTSIV